MLALGIFPLDALPAGWLFAYLGFLALCPLVVLAGIALKLRRKPWLLPQEFPVDPATLSPHVRRHIQPWLGRLGFLGFSFHSCAREGQAGEAFVWRLVHPNDRGVALIKANFPSPGAQPRLSLTFLSFLPDGQLVVTVDHPLPPCSPSHWHPINRRFKTIQAQVELHRSRTEGIVTIIPQALPERLATEEKAQLEALLDSGAFTPLAGEQQGARPSFAALPKLACRRFAALVTGAGIPSGRRVDVATPSKRSDLDEEAPVAARERGPEETVEDHLKRFRLLTAIKPDKKYYVPRIAPTVVTVVAFLWLFGWDDPRRIILSTLGLLATHEFGHWIMMKIFGFTGMGRFFIPFLGPLDRGRKLHAPAWQQFIVILAGPLPGLLAGIAVLIAGYFLPLPHLFPEFGAMAVVLNAFHLLPFLPLDGGRIVDLLLFRDLPILRPFFTGISALLVLLASFFMGRIGRVLRYIAITMFGGLIWDIKMVKVVRGGRRLGWTNEKDEDETLRKIFQGIREDNNDGFFQDPKWHRQIEVLLAEVMRKRPKFAMRVFGGAIYAGTFLLPVALVIGVLSIAYYGLFGGLEQASEASAEYSKDFPYKELRLAEPQQAAVSKVLDLTASLDGDDPNSLISFNTPRKDVAAKLSPSLLPALDRLNWQHAGQMYHQHMFLTADISAWFEVLCGRLEFAHGQGLHAESLLRAEAILHGVASMEPALIQSDRALFRDAELRSLAVIERLAAAGKLDPATIQRIESRIGLLNKIPVPEVENKLLVEGWSATRLFGGAGIAKRGENPAPTEKPASGWKEVYRLFGEGIRSLSHLGAKPVNIALAADWKKTRRAGTLPDQLDGSEHLSVSEAGYILRFCEGYHRMTWRRLATLSALRLEAHRLKTGSLPATWEHTLPGGAVIALDHNSGPHLRLTDKRALTGQHLPGWIAKAADTRAALDYRCPLFGSELSSK